MRPLATLPSTSLGPPHLPIYLVYTSTMFANIPSHPVEPPDRLHAYGAPIRSGRPLLCSAAACRFCFPSSFHCLLFYTTTSITMPPARHTRGTQPTSMGLGHHFVSPKKARDPKKTQTLVHIPGINSKHQRLLDQMAALMQPQVSTTETPTSTESQAPMDIEHTAGHVDDTLNYDYDDNDYIAEEVAQPAQVASCPTNVPKVDLGRRCLLPNKMANNLYNAWKVLIPTLVDPHLKYSTRTHGCALPEVHPVISACASHTSCTHRQFSIVCLFFDRK